MAGRRTGRVLGALALLVGLLALARLVDAVGKRQLLVVARELSSEAASLRRRHDMLAGQRDRLELDRQLLEHRLAVMSKREHYLVILRGQNRLRLGLEDKILAEVPIRVRGPQDAVDEFLAMPRTTYQVLAKRTETSWYRPDWLYVLEGVDPPADSAARVVPRAMGPVALELGGGLAIHGPVSDDVPTEAVDYVYVQLDTVSLKGVAGSIGQGALVFVH
ncbi:hypothetical protein FJY71_01860 [candidate division WOR-3 bacterium]|nr:hypothetical protein [candidate division WOR-3 bacterium]